MRAEKGADRFSRPSPHALDQPGPGFSWLRRTADYIHTSIGIRHGACQLCPRGTLAELLVRRGGRVVWYRDECRLPFHILDHIDATSTLNGMIRRNERAAFSEFEHHIDTNGDLAERIDALAQAYSTAVRNGVGRHYRWAVADPPTGAPAAPALFPKSQYSELLSLYSSTLTDQPAADRASSSTTSNGSRRL